MTRWGLLSLAAWLALAGPAHAEHTLKLIKGEREPAQGRKALTDPELAALRDAVAADPRDRGKRFALVQGLVSSGRLPQALDAARAWREVDAYNLVVVRMLGDIYAELGDADSAKRVYSAVVELLPEDAQAHRALATVLKQQGDLAGAYDRLAIAARMAPDDARVAFELADAAHRLGRMDEAEQRFLAIVNSDKASAQITYPAKQRLAQIYAARGQTDEIPALRINGGTENDIKVYLTWDTDKSDVDLWVTTPSGQKVFYQQKKGRDGEALYDDVTTGYGPESFTAEHAQKGAYQVQVNYFGTNRASFVEARGEVVIILSEGTPREQRTVLPYRLFAPGQTVNVARVEVK